MAPDDADRVREEATFFRRGVDDRSNIATHTQCRSLPFNSPQLIGKIDQTNSRHDRVEWRGVQFEILAIHDARFGIRQAGGSEIRSSQSAKGLRQIGRQHVTVRPNAASALYRLLARAAGNMQHA